MNEKVLPHMYHLSHSIIEYVQPLFIYANTNYHPCTSILHQSIFIHSSYSFIVFLPLSGNYFNKKDKTAMVAQDYGFIDAPPSSKPNNNSAGSSNRQQTTVVNNNNSGIQTKETNGNHSRPGKSIYF